MTLIDFAIYSLAFCYGLFIWFIVDYALSVYRNGNQPTWKPPVDLAHNAFIKFVKRKP